MKKCVVSVGVNGEYPLKERRLVVHLETTNPSLPVLSWVNCYPPDSPDHATLPYAFKAYALAEAKRQGYELLLWLDSAVSCFANIDPIFKIIEKDGYLIANSDARLHMHSSDYSLSLFGRTRHWAEHESKVKVVGHGAFFGFNLAHPIGLAAYEDFWNAIAVKKSTAAANVCFEDPRCRFGHRNEEVILALILEKHNLAMHNTSLPIEGRILYIPSPFIGTRKVYFG